jgi:hypothetical protein
VRYFTQAERQQQLQLLAEALARLLPELELSGQYSEQLGAYRNALRETQRLLEQGFVQDDLGMLSRGVPRLFWLHKEWTPPLEQSKGENGACFEPAWFRRLAPFEECVTAAAEKLKVIGEY